MSRGGKKLHNGSWEEGMQPCAKWNEENQRIEKDQEMTEVSGLAKSMSDLKRSLGVTRSFSRKMEIMMDVASPSTCEACMRSRAFFVMVKRKKERMSTQGRSGWTIESQWRFRTCRCQKGRWDLHRRAENVKELAKMGKKHNLDRLADSRLSVIWAQVEPERKAEVPTTSSRTTP